MVSSDADTITLKELLRSYPHLRLAGPEENERILSFLTKVNMQTPGMNLRYAREPDFFTYLGLQSEKSYVFILSNDVENFSEIQGFGIMSLTTQIIHGQKKKALYFSDVRMSPELCKEAKVQWKVLGNAFVEDRERIEELKDVDYVGTAVLDGNKMMKKLVNDRRQPIRYRHVFKYYTHLVLGRWKPKALSGLKLPEGFVFEQGSESTKGAIREFVLSHPTSPELHLSGEEFDRRVKMIPEFSWNNFMLIKQSGRIVGCTYPMTESSMRRMAVSGLSLFFKSINALLRVMGAIALDKKGEFKLMHTFFLRTAVEGKNQIEESDLALKLQMFLLEKVYEFNRSLPIEKRCQFVTIKGPQNEALSNALKNSGFIAVKTPATFYQIVHRKTVKRSELLHKSKTKMPEFEIGLA